MRQLSTNPRIKIMHYPNPTLFPYYRFPLFYAPTALQQFVQLVEATKDKPVAPSIKNRNLWAYNIPLAIQQKDLFTEEAPSNHKINRWRESKSFVQSLFNNKFSTKDEIHTWIEIEQYLQNPSDKYSQLFHYLKRAYNTQYLAVSAISPQTNINYSDSLFEYVILPFYEEAAQNLSTKQGSLFSTPEHPNEEEIEEFTRDIRLQFKLCIKLTEYQQGRVIIAKERGLCVEGERGENVHCFLL